MMKVRSRSFMLRLAIPRAAPALPTPNLLPAEIGRGAAGAFGEWD